MYRGFIKLIAVLKRRTDVALSYVAAFFICLLENALRLLEK